MFRRRKSDPFGQLDHFRSMAARVPAYRAFLQKYEIDPDSINNIADLAVVPVMDKRNYIDEFSLPELCWDGQLAHADYIVNSSGSTGMPYFWPRTHKSDELSNRQYETIFKDIFKIDDRKTLFINSYGQGSWIAGVEAFLAARSTGMNMVTINSGIDTDLIVKQLDRLSSYFEVIIFAGYPPFVKDLFEEIARSKTAVTEKHLVHVIVGGESISEAWRAHLSAMLPRVRFGEVVSIYGMSDGGGILAYETPLTRRLRSLIFNEKYDDPAYDLDILGGIRNTALFQYNPSDRYFEVTPSGNLLVHVRHGVPLFKYDTKDRGEVVEHSLLEESNVIKSILREYDEEYMKNPFVYLLGRSDYAQTLYGLLIYPEHIRAIIDKLQDRELTGRFILETRNDETMTQYLNVVLELVEGRERKPGKAKKTRGIEDVIYDTLPKYSSEYKKLVESIGLQARPIVRLAPFGAIGYMKGKKHRWVKKD